MYFSNAREHMLCDFSLGNLTFDGHNVWPLLNGERNTTDYDEIILNIDQLRNVSALRKGDWKVISGKW